MIATLRGRMSGVVHGAVLLREAARTSRRWQTYLARAAFSGVLLALVLLAIWLVIAAPFKDASNLGWVGHTLFVVFAVFEILLAVFVAPMFTARAIIEERLDGTLPMLVLTPIRPGALLAAKVLSRVLIIVTLVLGATPLLALVTTLGGVSASEVVLVTLGALVATLVMGSLGGFFGLFTRSPLVATLAALGWAALVFLVLPPMYALVVGSPWAMAHLSPVYVNTARGWWGLLLLPTYVPVVWLVYRFGAPLFQLRMANAELRRLFADDVWQTRRYLIGGAVFLVASIAVLPASIVAAWYGASVLGMADWPTAANEVLPFVIRGAGRGLGWLWFVGLVFLGTWVYLRLGMDLVDALDGFLDNLSSGRRQKRRDRGNRIWTNPVAWRETRMSSWGSGAMPVLIGWIVLLFAAFQTGWWVIPGGLLAIGGANVLTALVLTAWLGGTTIAEERKTRSLEMLSVSTMPSLSVVAGKLLAVLLPTLPMIALTMPLLILGYPHLRIVFRADQAELIAGAMRGVASSVWIVPVWLAVATGSLAIALWVRRASAAPGLAIAVWTCLIGLPAVWAWVVADLWWLALPGRLVTPALVFDSAWWEFALSTAGWSALAIGLGVVVTVRMRVWSARV